MLSVNRKHWQLTLFDVLTIMALVGLVLATFRERDGRYVLAMSLVTGAWLARHWVMSRSFLRLQLLILSHVAVLGLFPFFSGVSNIPVIFFDTEWVIVVAGGFFLAQVVCIALPLRERQGK